MTAQELITAAVARLNTAGIEDAARDARKLLAYALEIDASRVTLVLRDDVPAATAAAFDALIARRAKREPVSHLTGTRAFYGRMFEVGGDVLDPRPETEILIEAALAVSFGRVLDMGTGSGCIIATLLAERGADAVGVATDLSAAALAVAARNAATAGVADHVQFFQGDWYHALPKGQTAFDLIVSNPPYIAAEEMLTLAPEVTEFEPRMALTDEADGLQAYRTICANAGAHLTGGGWLMMEIGPTQGGAVSAMCTGAGLEHVRVVADLDGRDRVVIGQKPR